MEASSSRTGSVSAELDLDATDPEIPSLLLEFEDALATYVREPLVLPRWLPRTTWAMGPSWTEADIDRMSSMYMPETPFGNDKPDMLLYELGNLEALDECFPARLADFVSGEDHLLLVERSGAGKTRLVFETLCHHWGLYFTCSSDSFVSPYGSDDIRMAIHRLSSLGIDEMLYPLNPRSRILRDKLHENLTKTRTLVAQLVLSRLLVFHLFYKHVKACNLPLGDARRKWLFLQLRSHCIFPRTDIFNALRHDIRGLSYEMAIRDIRRLHRSSAAVLEFIAVDEAQVAGRTYDSAFTSPDRRSHRPFLAQLVTDLSSLCPKQRLIISGVEGSHTIVQEAVTVSSPKSRVRQFLGLGMFGTLQRVRGYLTHFRASEAVDCCEVFRWLGGRHRLLAVFVAYCLLAGWDRWRSVMATMVRKLTGFYDLGDPVIDEISLSPLVSAALLDGSPVAWRLRHALYMHAMHSQQSVTLDTYASDIVTLALGRYGTDTSTVLIDERIIFLSLYNWLRESWKHSFHALISGTQSGSLRGLPFTGFLEDLAQILWNAHAKRVDVGSIFLSDGSPPAWATACFQLSLPQLASHKCSVPAQRYRPSQLITYAQSPEDVHVWFNAAPSPFLIPDAACGVEMVCILELDADHRFLVCFETEKRVLSSLRRRARLTPTHPSAFYEQDPAARERWKGFWMQITHSLPPATPGSRSRFTVMHVLCYTQPSGTRATSTAHISVLSHDYLSRQSDVGLRLSDLVESSRTL